MDAFSAAEHVHVACDSPLAGPGSFGIVDAPDDRIAVAGVELCERSGCVGVAVEFALQIRGNRGGALPFVGSVPASVGLGALDLGEAGWSHPPGGG